ncbi:sorbin and SH3 domain-containing protein 1 isoform X16 [Drosophila hydei]|uniref:Sorbin and SH3 domain-containing protein 1 isoform X16 n=1 Tax=Drosophila hydei TaxID=7224 RepID=A0A6J1L4N1_DROHY|nr:sorbin and SH3 domain-containing protein 1 isoform X16 [Drosophila hydei]
MGQEHTQNNTTMFAPKFKARAPTGSGVWTPKSQTPYGSSNELDHSSSAAPTPPPPPTQPVWTPQPSPALSGRKEFRPVRFESPTLPRRYTAQQQQPQQQTTTTIPPWSYTNGNCPVPAPRSSTATTSTTNLSTPPSTFNSNNSDYAETDYSNQFGPVAPSASVSDKIKTFERSASTSELYRPFARRQLSDTSRPVYRPNEVIYKVKHEYMSEPETESDRPRKMAQLGPRQYDGIGPVTNDGMPIILRSEVQEPHQHEWYKRLYQTIHKQKNGDDFVIRYKCPRARPSYKSNGYVSEPEPNYDSDYSTVKYRTPNPLRVQSVSSAVNVRNLNQDDKVYGTMPNPIKSAQNAYKNQPGRIEDYTTGHSSVSEKEKKEWWDEVMDIFNGNLEQSKLSPHYTEGNLSRALAKESGYTSDSNLVFRKKELPVSSPLSPVEQRQAYKSLQAGGEPPLLGFRKPAPEKPKDFDSSAAPPPPIPPQPPLKGLANHSGYEPYSPFVNSNGDRIDSGTDVNIHFKTPLRHEYKPNISDEELAIRQAEHMQKLYQEERRRKYLQELQDMNSRRHTDNFTPSQKSPIALNRYDDFPTDVTLKSLVGPKTVARALYNFQGQSSKELSFRKGDTVYIRRQIDPNWYEGEYNAMIGLLPASYVEIISRDGARTPSKRPSEGQARAKYNFQAQSGVELSLNKGELVTLTRRVDGNWFEGKIANRKGIFPVSYVEVLTDIGAEDIAARTTTVISTQSTTNLRPNLDVLRTNINNEFNTLTQNGAHPPNGILKESRTLHKTDALHVDTSSEPLTYRALYKYRPQNSDELEILEGDLVHVLEKCDDGWFVGTSQRTGCFGTFPGNYVERA